jgi:hypothetical protein
LKFKNMIIILDKIKNITLIKIIFRVNPLQKMSECIWHLTN